MEFYSVRFDESAVVVIEPGIPVEHRDGNWLCEFGTDVGGETLTMLPLRATMLGFDGSAGAFEKRLVGEQLMRAELVISPDGKIVFRPEKNTDDRRVFVLFRAMQRSPDARTETADYSVGTTCIGNALDRPFDVQLLVLEPGAEVRFRRFGRGGEFGAWQGFSWDGQTLSANIVQVG